MSRMTIDLNGGGGTGLNLGRKRLVNRLEWSRV